MQSSFLFARLLIAWQVGSRVRPRLHTVSHSMLLSVKGSCLIVKGTSSLLFTFDMGDRCHSDGHIFLECEFNHSSSFVLPACFSSSFILLCYPSEKLFSGQYLAKFWPVVLEMGNWLVSEASLCPPFPLLLPILSTCGLWTNPPTEISNQLHINDPTWIVGISPVLVMRHSKKTHIFFLKMIDFSLESRKKAWLILLISNLFSLLMTLFLVSTFF